MFAHGKSKARAASLGPGRTHEEEDVCRLEPALPQFARQAAVQVRMPLRHPAARTLPVPREGLLMTGKPLLRDAGVVGLAILIGMVTALALGQFVLVRLLKERLNDYTAGLLQHAAEVASVSIATFAQAGASTTPLCSDADLNALRYLLFYREHLHDIGRVRDGQLLCTAGWGRLDPPVRLAPPQRRPGGGAAPPDRRSTTAAPDRRFRQTPPAPRTAAHPSACRPSPPDRRRQWSA